MADKDVTGFTSFMDSWLPQKIKANSEPIIASAENTLNNARSTVRNDLMNKIVKSTIALKSLQAKVLDSVNDKLTSSEGKLDALQNKVFNKIDTSLLPLESKTAIGMGVCGVTSSGEYVNPELCSQAIASGGTINPVQIGPGGLPISGTIENIQPPPTQPIDNIQCPPAPPCPIDNIPCPDNPYDFCVWSTDCIPNIGTCSYIIPKGIPPLNQNDVLMLCISDPQGKGLGDAWNQAQDFCEQHSPPCKPNPLNLPPQPVKPGGMCCPPAQIQNIVNPPQGGQIQNQQLPGGQIQNIINIPNPIINEPLPISQPRPPITGFGQIINDTVSNVLANFNPFPTGDMAYFIGDENSQSKIGNFWASIGIIPSSYLGNQTPIDWFNGIVKDVLTFIPGE